MSISHRYMIFFAGILVQAAGISLVVKSLLGTSPISSVPYVFSLAFPYSLGEMTFAVNMLFLLAQILILRRSFDWVQLLQAPVTLLFAAFIDFTMFLFAAVQPAAYPACFSVLLAGAVLSALGVALQVIVHVFILPGEGIREGTLVSAFITGSIARFFIRHLSRVGRDGQLVFSFGGEK